MTIQEKIDRIFAFELVITAHAPASWDGDKLNSYNEKLEEIRDKLDGTARSLFAELDPDFAVAVEE